METKDALRRALRYLYRGIKKDCEKMKTKDTEAYLFLKEIYLKELRNGNKTNYNTI
jgi:hypothetical protein